jgi:hypothetical protein
MLDYTGDFLPVLLTSGTEINTGTTVTEGLFTTENSVQTARMEKPMFYVTVTTATTATGSMIVGYQEKINDFHAGVDKTVTVPMIAINSTSYMGIVTFTNDFSAITVKSIKNSLNQKTVTYKVYVTGR